jgi:hypothetical protein
MQVCVRYGLNLAAASDSVKLEFYGPDLSELGSLTGQPHQPGTHTSDFCTLSGVDFDQNDDPVGPIYCVLSAEENANDAENNRDQLPKPALQNGTTSMVEAIKILHPDGQPSLENKVTFDDTPAPDGSCSLDAQGMIEVLGPDADLELGWELSPVMAGSTLTTSPSPAKGPSVTFTYTGLPESNGDFGPATLTLSHPDLPSTFVDTEEIRIFYHGLAKNHAGDESNTTPNWYYYWRDGNIVSDLAQFEYAPGEGYGSYHPPGSWPPWQWGTLFVHDSAPTINEEYTVTHTWFPLHQEVIGTTDNGLMCCAATCAHELEHAANWGRCDGQLDTDGDGVSDAFEDGTCVPGGYYLDKYVRDTYNIEDTLGYGGEYGDDEFLARKAEQMPGAVDPAGDWSDASTYGRNYFWQP